MSVIDVFPKRPIQLAYYYHRPTWWYLILICIGIAAMAYEGYSAIPSLVDDYRLRAGGKVALQSSLENGVCHMRAVNDCEFDAQYVTADGSSYTRHVELYTVFQEPDQKSDFIVRYEAEAPQHISTSWGAHLLVNRTLTLMLTMIFLLMAVAYVLLLLVNPRRMRSKLAAIGAQPTPLEVKFEGAVPGSGYVDISFSWTDATGRPRTASTELQGTSEPFWLDATKTKMLAVAGPEGQAHLLDAALASVGLTSQERVRIIQTRDGSLDAEVALGGSFRASA